MARLTYKNPDGTFGLNNGYDMHKVPTELYGAIWKLKDYEETGLDPETLKEIDKLYLEKCEEVNRIKAELGTVKECKAAEKKSAKRPIRNDKCTCPSCGTHNEVIKNRRNTVFGDIVYCWHCGQALKIFRSDKE